MTTPTTQSAVRSPQSFVDLSTHDHPTPAPQLRWPERPGAQWIPAAQLGAMKRELTVHWTEQRTPAGLPLAAYLARIGAIAHYHAFTRNWNDGPGAPIPGFGLMYHYMVTPPDDQGVAHLVRTQPERLITWNAGAANVHNLAVCVLAGPGDPVYPATATLLEQFLTMMCHQRPDLPGITAHPGTLGGTPTFGVTTHDETRARYGQPPKGCCGVYAPVVRAWRAAQG